MIIGLDIATKMGVALGKTDAAPKCYTVVLGGTESTHDQRFAQCLRTTHGLIKTYGPRLVVIEATIIRKHDKKRTNDLLMGLVGCARGILWDRGIECRIVTTGTVDSYFLGYQPGAGKRKAAIREKVELLGWEAPDQDSADAASLWSYGCSLIDPNHGTQTMDLSLAARR